MLCPKVCGSVCVCLLFSITPSPLPSLGAQHSRHLRPALCLSLRCAPVGSALHPVLPARFPAPFMASLRMPASCAFRGVFARFHPCAAPFFVVPVGSVAPSRRVAAFHGIAHAACSCEAFSLASPALRLARLSRSLPSSSQAGAASLPPPWRRPPADSTSSAPRSVCRSRETWRSANPLSLSAPICAAPMRPCACPPSRHGTSFRVIANMPPSSLASSASPADAAPCSLPQSHVGAAIQKGRRGGTPLTIDGDR